MAPDPDPIAPRAFSGRDEPAALAQIDQIWARTVDVLGGGQIVAFQLFALRADTGRIESTALARSEVPAELLAHMYLEAARQSRVHFESVVAAMRERGFELELPDDALPWRP